MRATRGHFHKKEEKLSRKNTGKERRIHAHQNTSHSEAAVFRQRSLSVGKKKKLKKARNSNKNKYQKRDSGVKQSFGKFLGKKKS